MPTTCTPQDLALLPSPTKTPSWKPHGYASSGVVVPAKVKEPRKIQQSSPFPVTCLLSMVVFVCLGLIAAVIYEIYKFTRT